VSTAETERITRLIAIDNRMAAMLDTPANAPLKQWPSEPEIDAVLAEWRAMTDCERHRLARTRSPYWSSVGTVLCCEIGEAYP